APSRLEPGRGPQPLRGAGPGDPVPGPAAVHLVRPGGFPRVHPADALHVQPEDPALREAVYRLGRAAGPRGLDLLDPRAGYDLAAAVRPRRCRQLTVRRPGRRVTSRAARTGNWLITRGEVEMRTTHRWLLAGAAGASLLWGGAAQAGTAPPPMTNLGGT